MDELDTLICKALERAPEGLTHAALQKALPKGMRPSRERLGERLEALTKSNRIFVWPGRAPRFAMVAFEAFGRERVLSTLAESSPLTEAELKRKLPRAIGTLAKTLINSLVADGSVLRHPPLARRVRYALQPPDALAYLQAEMETIHQRLAKLGFSEEERENALRRYALGSAPVVESDDDILQAMQQINPQANRGALVYLSEVRSALRNRYPDKTSFDRAVLKLADRAKVQLQSHAWPSSLSAQEKEALIDNGRGSFFDAIGIRLE